MFGDRTLGLGKRMPFPRNRIFPVKMGKVLSQTFGNILFPVPSQSQKWNGNFRIWNFVYFETIQDFPEWYWVVQSRPKFFSNFFEQRDQKTVVLSQYRQFGKWPPVSSCLKKARKRRPIAFEAHWLLKHNVFPHTPWKIAAKAWLFTWCLDWHLNPSGAIANAGPRSFTDILQSIELKENHLKKTD